MRFPEWFDGDAEADNASQSMLDLILKLESFSSEPVIFKQYRLRFSGKHICVNFFNIPETGYRFIT